MRSPNPLNKILLTAVILALGFVGFYFISAKGDFLTGLKGAFSAPVGFVTNFWQAGKLAEENYNLRIENESLRHQLEAQPQERSLWNWGLEYKPAVVYSTYPFNNKRFLGIDLGSEDGIVKLMPVAVSPEILLGRVTEVFPKYSLVQTVFDSGFKTPVRIGGSARDALLEGGNAPTVTLIKKEFPAAIGDAVYSAGIEFPYWMKIGELKQVTETDDEYFKKAELKVAYNLNEIKKVYVITNYVSK